MRRGLVFTLLLAFIILSACTSAGDELQHQPEQGHAAEETGSTDTPEEKEIVIPDRFYQLPQELILSPGAEYDLNVDGARFDVSDSSIISINDRGTIHVLRDAITGKQSSVKVSIGGESKEVRIKVKYSLADTIADINGVPTVTNPGDLVVLVNKERALPSDYIPQDLVSPQIPFSFQGQSEKKLLRKDAAKALEALFAKAKEEGIELIGVSGYRSYNTQKAIFNRNVEKKGLEATSQYSAEPGHSEHQTGLSIDVYNKEYKYALEESFADTEEGKWLAEHAAEFGFIIRYPKGKEEITGYNYEPWHIRYVGIDVAKEIKNRGITLEEYFQDADAVSKD